MAPERRRRVEELYRAALAHAERERPAFLAGACAGDEALRREIEALLVQGSPTDTFPGPITQLDLELTGGWKCCSER
jgi:hypothetical protein